MPSVLNDMIDEVITSYQSTEEVIVEGSDEHLDLILNVKNHLDKMTNATILCTDYLEIQFNTISELQAKEILIKLMPCFRMAHQVISIIKKSAVYKGVKTSISNLSREVDELKEIVSDISRYKLSDNTELQNLISSIKFECN